jgi:hypothetical protein
MGLGKDSWVYRKLEWANNVSIIGQRSAADVLMGDLWRRETATHTFNGWLFGGL